jgi:ABC-type nitrate/sulfonate/bicarbonate transport system substrate-binding protein
LRWLKKEEKMFIARRLVSIRARKRFQILLGSIFLLICPLIVGGAEIGGKPEKGEVTIAYVSPSAAFTPLFIAAEAGLFAKHGSKSNCSS